MENEENVYIDLPVVGTDNAKIENELKELGLKKPATYPPIIENNALKALGFNGVSLKDELLRKISSRYRNKYDSLEYILNSLKNRGNYSPYYLSPGQSIPKDLEDKIKKYTDFKNNHEKIKTYYKNKEVYNSKLNELKTKYTFSRSKYNKPGYLLTIIHTKTDKVSFFLVGTKQRLSDSFSRASEYRVLKAKKVVSDEEINGMMIFD